MKVLGMIHNDKKSMWVVGESEESIAIGFIFFMGPKWDLSSAFSKLQTNDEEKRSLITAVTVDKGFVVSGDVRGNMWFLQLTGDFSWSSRKPAHKDRISVLRLSDHTIISASYDRTVKLWDRNTKKQIGMFVCGGPILELEVNPEKPTELVCGDGQGKLYFLSWKE
ncbi:mitochondrial division protein 1-like [Micropterus salmoides]|uniref:mitochondrial division protein 1-like n=1 Tax=Micropterus salmoides TaxID=27706 RepID=UPI0018ED43B5|nr:mitochondrial division protein 1-like [Micropterus salmoides]